MRERVTDSPRECPFCGSEDLKLMCSVSGDGKVTRYAVECQECQARGPVMSNLHSSSFLALEESAWILWGERFDDDRDLAGA